jgi:hypothetical protein
MENSFKHITNINKSDTSLNVENQSNSTLIFPRDMQKEFYPEAIKFSVYERAGVSYDEIKASVSKVVDLGQGYLEAKSVEVQSKSEIERLQAENNKEKKPQKEIDENNEKIEAEEKTQKGLRDKLDGFGAAVTGVGNNVTNAFVEAREEQKLEKTIERHLQSIYLAMPESVNFAEGIDWQGSDLGVVGGLKSGAIGTDNIVDYGVLTGGGAALGGAAGLAASLVPGISGIAGTIVGAALGSGTLQAGIESTFGVKTNPFKEQTFQGVGFRPFDFSFNFRARSQTDVLVIRNIINAFRSYSKPTFKEGSKGSIFKYPKEFRIEFLTMDDNNSYVTNEYLPEIKFCICTAINTNFTAQGWKSFEGGAPTDITLQMTFQETEIVTGEDVSGNTKNGRFAGYKGRF